ncbi:MAG TPA: PucR family transcriptional regulator ligand-binding domain-containing protein, partial [Chloroflexota bacterium]|nr:PucR family transcriptional regulator ligand-binding domain-containing protein [Chloroflexota bacterium]
MTDPLGVLDGTIGGDRPAVTVRDVMRLVLPAGTTVIGGASGLERAVTWARLIHLDLPTFERIEQGEMALAVLPTQSEAPHSLLARLLQMLAERGISGLAVSGNVPPGAQALADAIGTPLLSLPPEVRLPEVEKSIIGLIVNRRAELEQRGVQIYRQLAQQTIENRGIEAIIETLAEIAQKPVAIEDDRGTLEFFQSDARWQISREELQAALRQSRGETDWFKGQTLTSTSPPVVRRALAAPGWARLVAPIVVRGTPVGFLSIIGREDELDELDRVATGRAAAVCALEIAKRQAITEAETRIRSDFLDDLFAGRFTSEAAILSRGQLLGFDPTRPYVVVIFDLDTSSAYLEWMSSHNEQYSARLRGAFSRGLSEELTRVNPGALLRMNAESAVALYPVDPEEGLAVARSQIEEVRQRVVTCLEGMTVSAAVGRAYSRALDAPRAYREAEQTLTIALRLFGPNRTTVFDDLGIYRLLFHLHGTPELTSFYEETLQRVVE